MILDGSLFRAQGIGGGVPAEFEMGGWWDFREERVESVTHWMPFPNPPVSE